MAERLLPDVGREARALKDDERRQVRLVATVVQGSCRGMLEDFPEMETLYVVLGLAEALNHFAARLVLRATEANGTEGREAAQFMLQQVYARLTEHQDKLSTVVDGMAKRSTN